MKKGPVLVKKKKKKSLSASRPDAMWGLTSDLGFPKLAVKNILGTSGEF